MSEDLFFLKKEKTDFLVDETETNSEERLEFKATEPKASFVLDFLLLLKEGSWLVGIPNLEVYNYVYNMSDEINNFSIYSID